SASAGANILVVRDSSAMKAYLSSCYQQFNVVFVDTQSVVNQNGDDAIELFMAGDIIETYGNSNEDGTGKPWEYTGSWAFKNAEGLWINGAINCTDSTETIYDADCVYPICEMIKVT
ncbi:hypothetical protein, partial [Umezakia ovalisporum]|uniref:hypothetical protein n=1 Tax=Umezakia ovalisporum TaxID=75695 RepID=UPI0039C723A3